MAFKAKGFSLIELLITIVIMGVILGLGLPALTTYTRNVKLRANAESFLAGLQMARGEAVRLNTPVELILTNDPPIPDIGADVDHPVLAEVVVDNLGNVVATGKSAANFPVAKASSSVDPSYNWLVRTLPTQGGACGANPAGAAQQAKACWFITGKRGAEGSGTDVDSASQILIEGPASVTFTALGGANAAADFNISNPGGGACAPGGPMRCLRVRLELGGRAKLCDPAATTAGDTRGC
mgnify:CR=1 FL=1